MDYITKRTQFEQTSKEVTQALQTVEGAPKDEYRGAFLPSLPLNSS